MKEYITIYPEKTQKVFRITNICILLFTTFWIIGFSINLWKHPLIDTVTPFLMLGSLPFLLTGIAGTVYTYILKEKRDYSLDKFASLILNIEPKDFHNHQLEKLKRQGNFLILNNQRFIVNYKDCRNLLPIAQEKGLNIELATQKVKSLNLPPKEIFNDCMSMLWAAS